MTISRRLLLKSLGASALFAPRFLGRPAIGAALPLANAVEFFQGNASKLSSVLYGDATRLWSQLFAERAFFTTSYQLQKYMPATYPGNMTLISLTDALGHPRFQINMMPPSVMIPGSSGNNPSLQIMAAANSAATSYFSYVIPDFTVPDGEWHTMQVSVGILPTSPGRWVIEAVDINQGTSAIRANMGYFTNPMGTVPLTSQVPPAIFNIPVATSNLPNDGSLVLSMGLPLLSRSAGYRPLGGYASFYDALAAKVAETWLHLAPAANVDLTKTLPQFVSLKSVGQVLTSSISAASISAATASEVVAQLERINQPSTLAAAQQQVAAVVSSLANAANAGIKAGASALVQQSLIIAQQSANAAKLYLTGAPVAASVQAAATELIAAETSIADALEAANLSPTYAAQATTTVISTVNGVTVSASSPPPNVVLSGNGSTVTSVSTGDQVPASDNSYSYNQATGTILSSPTGQQPAQSPDDSYETIESISISPTP
jgi:hypothetical protein